MTVCERISKEDKPLIKKSYKKYKLSLLDEFKRIVFDCDGLFYRTYPVIVTYR